MKIIYHACTDDLRYHYLLREDNGGFELQVVENRAFLELGQSLRQLTTISLATRSLIVYLVEGLKQISTEISLMYEIQDEHIRAFTVLLKDEVNSELGNISLEIDRRF